MRRRREVIFTTTSRKALLPDASGKCLFRLLDPLCRQGRGGRQGKAGEAIDDRRRISGCLNLILHPSVLAADERRLMQITSKADTRCSTKHRDDSFENRHSAPLFRTATLKCTSYLPAIRHPRPCFCHPLLNSCIYGIQAHYLAPGFFSVSSVAKAFLNLILSVFICVYLWFRIVSRFQRRR